MIKSIIRYPLFQRLAGGAAYAWLRLVQATTRFIVEPRDPAALKDDAPVIVASWHGQQIMLPFARPPQAPMSALISRSGDGDIIANVLARFGVGSIRGSGGSGAKIFKRGGVPAFREMLDLLDDGVNVALTADVPKVARVCGKGIVTLAKLSGRPIYPFVVVCGRRLDFNTWDRTSMGLPFGRGAIVYGAPIRVAGDADPAALELARQSVEQGLDEVTRRAYELVGGADPGANLAPRIAAK